jgi:hypothetical protein
MDARTELFAYLGASLATIAGLFVVQLWYESYLDVAVVHAQHRDAPLDPKLAEVRDAEHAKLSSGRLPIEQAIAGLAQRGRAGFSKIAPKPSDDLSAMSGWIRKPGFAPYVPRQAAAPATPEGAAAEGTPAAPTAGSAAEGATAAPAPAAAAGATGAVQGTTVVAPASPATAAPATAAIPSAPAGTTAEAAKAAAERVRPAGTRAPIEATRERSAPPGRTPSANPAP